MNSKNEKQIGLLFFSFRRRYENLHQAKQVSKNTFNHILTIINAVVAKKVPIKIFIQFLLATNG